MSRPSHALELVRVLTRKSTSRTWDPTIGLFWDTDSVARDLFPAEVCVETVTIVRRALADCLSMKESSEIVEWEKARTRIHKEVVTILRRAEDRLSHGSYRRDEDMRLVYEMDEPTHKE